MYKKHLTWLPILILLAGVPIVARADEHDSNKAIAYRAGYNYGYGIGYGDGQNDFRRGASFDLNNHDYKDRDKGYTKSLKHRDDYENGYQAGFRQGYQDGYSGHGFSLYTNTTTPGIAPVYVIEQPAYPSATIDGAVAVPVPAPSISGDAYLIGAQVGYRDGLRQGLTDVRTNQAFDPSRHETYQDASSGYSPTYGSKDQYRTGYRRGYEEGYRIAFGPH